MKKFISVCLCLLMFIGVLSGCTDGKAIPSGDKLSIVATIFPEYDWVRAILGDQAEKADLTLLLDNGVDLHSYQPTADDIIKISNCDMFIYVGGESDKWADDALKNAANKNMVVVNLLETLGDSAKTEKVVEGMQAEEENGDDHEEYDEHVWLSLKNAEVICRAIAEKLAEIDSDNKDVYISNANTYINKLSALDAEYKKAVDGADKKTLLFGDRFPFRYLADDYGLDYYAAFVGCSAETEASFETITFLAEKADELGLSCVLTLDGSDNKIAQTIISNTAGKNQKILSMDSMQSTTLNDLKNGTTYLSVMQKNLEVLKSALN
ncbi:MAG: metal ABC transporter substrate-binding protein [Acutalibacteraceae bacterium]|nr:metal ABC transporter substrate-binding protein [Oscillospiraceae bacterium]